MEKVFKKVYFMIILFGLSFTRDTVYSPGHKIAVYSNKIFPYDNPSETYQYYTLAFCKPEVLYEERETLGEQLSGDRKTNSMFELYF